MEYITTGESGKEMEIGEDFAFVIKKVGIFDETVKRRYPSRKVEGWRNSKAFERFDEGICGDSDRNKIEFTRRSNGIRVHPFEDFLRHLTIETRGGKCGDAHKLFRIEIDFIKERMIIESDIGTSKFPASIDEMLAVPLFVGKRAGLSSEVIDDCKRDFAST